MPTHSEYDLNKPFFDASVQENPVLLSQPPRRWSLTTLMAARPNPKHDTRASAIAWNREYAKVPQVQVDPADYLEVIPERTPAEVAENLRNLRKLSAEKPGLHVVDPWDRPE